jgi:heme-degrading monooxygenase HmoA
MIVVIFESWPAEGKTQKYLDTAETLRLHLDDFDGFISIERFQSVIEPGKLLALSVWRDEAAVDAWRNLDVHRKVQASSRKNVFRDYRLRVAAVIRDYGMHEREAAPTDSRTAHAQ